MAEKMSNKRLYSEVLVSWGNADRAFLFEEEKYLFDKYIKNARILEAGCGGGRVSRALNDKGYNNIDAFDFVESFIEHAKEQDSNVNFFVADATDLSMIEDNRYDYLIYLQQVISFVPPSDIRKALSESYRVCKNGGVGVFSFLNYDGRLINYPLSIILQCLRKIRKDSQSAQELPWLKVNGKINRRLFSADQATSYWFKEDEITKMLQNVGFDIIEIYRSSREKSMLYYACKKG